MSDPQPDYFREYHAVETRQRVTKLVAGVAIAATVIAIVTALSAGAPVAPEAAQVTAQSSAAEPTASAVVLLPAPDATVAASPTPSPLPTTGPDGRTWAISIDTTGYQPEIDRCLWVRMDLGTGAPFVGAHNYCGGSIVLEMVVGDIVTLTGTGLDGTYRVTGERLAQAGDNAADATAGFDADVILQTCFWVNDGSERLVSLQKA